MIAALEVIAYISAGLSAVLLLMAIPRSVPRPLALSVIGATQVVVMIGIVIDIAALVIGEARQIPNVATHVSYLITTPLIIPAGFALTYKKLDRWGMLIVGIAAVIATFMVIRQVQTLGVPFGYLNVRP